MAGSSFHIPLSHPNRLFSYYLNQIEQQRRMLQQVQRGLPDNLAKHACHCVMNNKTLVVYTDSAIWASQLRFYHRAMLAALAPLPGDVVQTIQIKVITQAIGISITPSLKANVPSVATIDMMQKQSATVSDKALQQSLERLNATLRRLADAG